MHIQKSQKIAQRVQYCMKGAVIIIHLVIPVILLVLFLSLYHGKWMS
ncbi:MAG: hypothetical protein GXY48_06550 [Methanomicrobiales archaeon]|nr:hypothetical protein [Methanomicrobiales archaeon]